MNKLIITIDTEGDNLWKWQQKSSITTDNVGFLPRFQELCNKYGFKPVWLTNYEMISNDDYVSFIKDVVEKGKGELGMHLHAWNQPPLYQLDVKQSGAPYLIEYPYDIMKQKFENLYNLIIDRTGIVPVSHRAGRWAMNDEYFSILSKYGIKVDCSFTPYINWNKSVGQTEKSVGSNYKKIRNKIYYLKKYDLYEMPTTIVNKHKYKRKIRSIKDLLIVTINVILGNKLWLRPNGNNLDDMLYILNNKKVKKSEYLMFMLHSSELMPGGSPTFKSEEEIEKLYSDLDTFFKEASKSFEGVTLKEFYEDYTK